MRFASMEEANAAAERGDFGCGVTVNVCGERYRLERLAGDGPEWRPLQTSPLEPGTEPARLFQLANFAAIAAAYNRGEVAEGDDVVVGHGGTRWVIGAKVQGYAPGEWRLRVVSKRNGTAVLIDLGARDPETAVPAPAPGPRAHTLPTDSAERKSYPIAEGCLYYFPAALAEVARVSLEAGAKHTGGQSMHHARGTSMDHEDCILRHSIDAREATGAARIEHMASRAWRALAALQEECESQGAPMAPNARKAT